MITTTLNRIREHSLCQDGWTKLLNGLGKTKADDEPLPFSKILEINGIHDALWCCRVEPQYAREWRLFAVTCARRVEHLNTDPRVKNAIDVAERYVNGDATDEELMATWSASGDVGWAAWVEWAVRAATKAARAAWSAAAASARDAGAAVKTAARAAANSAGWAAEREWQGKEFLRVVTETEARTA